MTDTSPSGPITLNVRTLEAQTYSVDISITDTVLQLKDRLASILSVPSPRQRLIFRGRVMADDKPLTEYSLEDGHTLHLVTRPADAPTNRQNDAPQRRAGSAAGSGPLRFDTRDYQFSIIGIDDGAIDQQIMQALGGFGGAQGLDMDLDGGSTLIQIGGDPSVK
ncbi:MAG: ubiquitin-related domain-containing protein [Linnemannia gamsii]|nr:MAG: ubiquitin-related domain-containing protein [Linnemannia gamsii]